MLNLSSILKKYKQKKSQTDQVLLDDREESKAAQDQEQKIQISSLINKDSNQDNNLKEVEAIYEELVNKAGQIYRDNFSYKRGLAKEINASIDKLIKYLSGEKSGWLPIFLQDYPANKEYLCYHVVNTCLLSIVIGLALRYETVRLAELGSAAFLHDIGIIKYLDLIFKKKILHEEEYAKIKKHPKIGMEILRDSQGEISKDIVDAIAQEHERLDGSGYPAGLKDKQISEYAQIIGLSDLYESMVHKRPYRSKFSSLQTVKLLLNNKKAFDCRLIKALIEKIGIFPVGVLVRLNTKETGSVVRENPRLPLRPIINVLFDGSNKQLREPKQIDLAVNPMIFIEECMECAGPQKT